jgi:hypothetical protein
MKRFGICVSMIFALTTVGWTVASSRAAPALPGLASPAEPSASPRIRLCECDRQCTATGEDFDGISHISVADACGKAGVQCRAAGCTSCPVVFSGCD